MIRWFTHDVPLSITNLFLRELFLPINIADWKQRLLETSGKQYARECLSDGIHWVSWPLETLFCILCKACFLLVEYNQLFFVWLSGCAVEDCFRCVSMLPRCCGESASGWV